jgi:hypothetical protein
MWRTAGVLAFAAALSVVALAGGSALAADNGCAARASRDWSPADQVALTVEATADGPSCALAVVTLAVRAEDGTPVWAQAFVAADNFILREGTAKKAMQSALRRWIGGEESPFASTAALPEWAPDAEAPGGEFPFRPSEVYANRDDYEALRAADLPLLCVVAGGESFLCAVYQDGFIDVVGTQSFPG